MEVAVRARMAVNEPDMLCALTRAGSGISILPALLYAADIATGQLQYLLPDWSSSGTPVHAVYPSSRHHSPKVMAFVDFLRARWPTVPAGPTTGTGRSPAR